MNQSWPGRANLLGDARAEFDHHMLDSSFHEWQDYRTLIEAVDRFIVVGRRGTGKSALTYRLQKDWSAKRFLTIVIAPNEEELIGLRPMAALFGDSVSRIRAGIKLVWRYALLMEVISQLDCHYKTEAIINKSQLLSVHLKTWNGRGTTCFDKVRGILKESIKGLDSPEERIAELPKILQLSALTSELSTILENNNKKFAVLIDRLDEGYEPDIIGVGIVDGLIYGTSDVRDSFNGNIQAILFLRDNIFRAIQIEDQDFSRNIEGQVLRLHWDPQELFYLVTKRLRAIFNLSTESDLKVWNQFTANEMQGKDGFKRALQLTLYRPRDVIALLNTAFYNAKKQQRTTLIAADIELSSKAISSTRFDDLGKEYESVFPGVKALTLAFSNRSPKLTFSEAHEIIQSVRSRPDIDSVALQHLTILGKTEEIIKALYGIGFLGIYDELTSNYIFCHDGKKSEKIFGPNKEFLIHPCYWSALNLQTETITEAGADEIYDEYEIVVTSQTAELREKNLGRIISELNHIKTGQEHASEFEEWCKKVIEIAFARQLSNIQLHPNKNAALRRDILATNEGMSGFWKRIREDYSTRQVIFEVKNFEKLTSAEYSQMASYLGREYGQLGFIICRDKEQGLEKGSELDAFREFYHKNSVIIKLTAGLLVSILSKLRSPQKHDAGETLLGKLLDTHIRLYSSGQTEKKVAKRKR